MPGGAAKHACRKHTIGLDFLLTIVNAMESGPEDQDFYFGLKKYIRDQDSPDKKWMSR